MSRSDLYAQIVLPLPPIDWESEEGGLFTYATPPELTARLKPGVRVVVPFGRRRDIGLLAGWCEQPPKGITPKPILDVLDAEPIVSEELLRLTRWVASYYLCSWGEALRAALPGVFEPEQDYRVYPVRKEGEAELPKRLRAILARLHAAQGVHARKLERDGVRFSDLLRLAELGFVRLEGRTRSAEPAPLSETYYELTPKGRAPEALDALKERAPAQARLLEELLAADGPLSASELKGRLRTSRSALQALQAKGLIRADRRPRLRAESAKPDSAPSKITLTEAQRQALSAIEEALRQRRYRTFLLHGVTGSGKTQVYIEAIRWVLRSGGSAIVLVPEIALTPQIVERFCGHLGAEAVVALHSRLSEGERADAYRGIHAGRFRVVIGARSAVFAPVRDLRLIVVDEEHEPSYKQLDPAPRYHARDVAVQRAAFSGAVCVLGSATPSLEAYQNARTGKFLLLRMPERIHEAQLPEVRLIDLTRHPCKGSLSAPLERALQERLRRGEQVILLQNRRGYAPVLECQDCGWTPMCAFCAVTLTYHKSARQVRCHYCGHAERAPDCCPRCQGVRFMPIGVGTQRVEEDLRARFPEARVIRMDLDTTAQKGAHARLLRRFAKREADVLLGTQMVAKGLDFPYVTLVGVINADISLRLPDFRSAERTFQLIAQVAGRAGRKHLPGEVIVQTRNPEHYSLRMAAHHDYEGFFAHELAQRRALGYPPCGRLILLEFRHGREERAQEAAVWFADRIRAAQTGALVLGPEAALIRLVKRTYRFQVLLKFSPAARSRLLAPLRQALKALQEQYPAVRCVVEVDPLGTL
ncbi:MAG: primosomal protein N' [Bacteroidota bacterium]|nr:primosomal protein N' [Bacteroidota bacterium]